MSLILQAVVINLIDRQERREAFIDRWQRTAGRDLPLTIFKATPGGDAGCLHSHRTVLSTFNGPLLVLEDDACFTEDFTLDITPPPDWAVSWFGGQHRLRPRAHDEQWNIPQHLVRTHAYVARDPKALAEAMVRIPRMDPYLSMLPIPQYVLRRHTVGQAAGRSDIDGTTRDADEYWQLPLRPAYSFTSG